MLKRAALGGSGSGDKQQGMSGRRGKKWRGNSEGDEFGQEEMSAGETGVNKGRGEESKDVGNEMSVSGMKGKSVIIRCWLAS